MEVGIHTVESSVVERWGYFQDAETFVVVYRSRPSVAYVYHGISAGFAQDLFDAAEDSIGKNAIPMLRDRGCVQESADDYPAIGNQKPESRRVRVRMGLNKLSARAWL